MARVIRYRLRSNKRSSKVKITEDVDPNDPKRKMYHSEGSETGDLTPTGCEIDTCSRTGCSTCNEYLTQ